MTTTSPAPHTAHAAPVPPPSPEATSTADFTADEILYLRARDVREALQEVDPVAVIRAVLRRHGAGDWRSRTRPTSPGQPPPGTAPAA